MCYDSPVFCLLQKPHSDTGREQRREGRFQDCAGETSHPQRGKHRSFAQTILHWREGLAAAKFILAMKSGISHSGQSTIRELIKTLSHLRRWLGSWKEHHCSYKDTESTEPSTGASLCQSSWFSRWVVLQNSMNNPPLARSFSSRRSSIVYMCIFLMNTACCMKHYRTCVVVHKSTEGFQPIGTKVTITPLDQGPVY